MQPIRIPEPAARGQGTGAVPTLQAPAQAEALPAGVFGARDA